MCEKLTNHVESLSALPTLSDWSLGRCGLSCSVAPKLENVVLVSGPEQEISGVTKLVDQRTFCTVSSSIPSGLVASCWPVLPGVWSESNLVEVLILINRRYARIGEQNLAGTAGVCVENE